MEIPNLLVIDQVPHPASSVDALGFPLDHPYVEHCWTASLGPTSVLLLRRVAWLWRQRIPAVVRSHDLARSVGLGPSLGASSPFAHALERLVRRRFAVPGDAPGYLDVYRAVPPVPDTVLADFPASIRRVHERLLDAHLEQLAAQPRGPGPSLRRQAEQLLARPGPLHPPPAADLTIAR